jgi:hypothetical protein
MFFDSMSVTSVIRRPGGFKRRLRMLAASQPAVPPPTTITLIGLISFSGLQPAHIRGLPV